MITAAQSARLTAATHLLDARSSLLAIRSSIAFSTSQTGSLYDLVSSIDTLFAQLIPNTPPQRDE